VLLCWSYYEPKTAPPLTYLTDRDPLAGFGLRKEQKQVSPQESAWSSLLGVYGFSHLDEFDGVLLKAIQNGFVDTILLKRFASELDTRARAARTSETFKSVWQRFHDSFDDNTTEFLEALHDFLVKHGASVDAWNLNSSIKLMKALGRADLAKDAITGYVSAHSGDLSAFALTDSLFGRRIDDDDLIAAFTGAASKCSSNQMDPRSILIEISDKHGWSEEWITYLASLTAKIYKGIFKNTKGQELQKVIDACLQFDRIDNASAEMRKIAGLAKEALREIGEESAINRERVKRYLNG
jgi:hypothetical protein